MIEIVALLIYTFLFATFQVFLVGKNTQKIRSYHVGAWLAVLIVAPILGGIWEGFGWSYIGLEEHFWVILKVSITFMLVVTFVQWQIHSCEKHWKLLGFLGGVGAFVVPMMYVLVSYPFYKQMPESEWQSIYYLVFGIFFVIQSLLCLVKAPTLVRWVLPTQLMFAFANMIFLCGALSGETTVMMGIYAHESSGYIASSAGGALIYGPLMMLYCFWYFWIPGGVVLIYGLRKLKKAENRIWVLPKEKVYLPISKLKTAIVATGIVALSLYLYCGELTFLFQTRDYQLEGYTVVAYTGNGGSIKIPDGVTHIKSGVFDGKNIKKVSFSETLSYIGEGAFQNNRLTEVDLPDSIEIVEANAFRNNDIASMSVSNDNSYIEESAFLGNPCSEETDGDIPMYGYTTELMEASGEVIEEPLPENMEIIDDEFLVQDGTILVEYLGNKSIVEIPYGITEIGEEAFAYIRLQSVVIPDTVRIIGEEAFDNTWMKEVEIPEGVEVIEYAAFRNCSLTELVLPNSLLEIGNWAFSNLDLETIQFGNQLQSIGDSAFKESIKMEVAVILPEAIAEIGAYAFAENTITEVVFPENDIVMDATSFKNTPWLDGLQEEFIIVGDGVLIKYKGINPKAVIPEGVRRISGSVFEGYHMTEVVLPSTLEHIGDNAFARNDLDRIVFPEGLLTIGANSFYENRIRKVNFPDTVVRIGESAFCDNYLMEIKLPNTLEQIEPYAFSKNYIMNLSLPDTIQSIGDSAFSGSTIEYLWLPDSIKTIDDYAFGSNEIKHVQLPEELQEIGKRAFIGNQLISVTIPNTVEIIDDYAFADNQIIRFTLPDSVQNLGANILSETPWEMGQMSDFIVIGDGILCQYIGADTVVVVPEGIKQIGKYAFAEIEGSYSVVLPDSVTKIDENAFAQSGITAIRMSKNLKEIGASAFYETNLSLLTLPNTLETLDEGIWLDFSENEMVVIQYTEENQSIKEQFAGIQNQYPEVSVYLEKIEEMQQ